MTRLADAIFQRLKIETDAIFFVPGGGAMFLVDALGRSGIPSISAIHEQGAGAMALGYAMATGKLGVCLTTSGPGATNAITPCLAAWTDSVPVLFISGQSRSNTLAGISGRRSQGIQEGPIIDMVGPITKLARELTHHSQAIRILESAIYLAKERRPGPSWISIPQDIQAQEIPDV